MRTSVHTYYLLDSRSCCLISPQVIGSQRWQTVAARGQDHDVVTTSDESGTLCAQQFGFISLLLVAKTLHLLWQDMAFKHRVAIVFPLVFIIHVFGISNRKNE